MERGSVLAFLPLLVGFLKCLVGYGKKQVRLDGPFFCLIHYVFMSCNIPWKCVGACAHTHAARSLRTNMYKRIYHLKANVYILK